MIELELEPLAIHILKPSRRMLGYGLAGIIVMITGILGATLVGQITRLTCNQAESGRFVCEIQVRGECPEISSYLNLIVDALKPLKYDAECLTTREIPIGAVPGEEVFLLIGFLIIVGGFIRAKNNGYSP